MDSLLELEISKNTIWSSDASTAESLRHGFYGVRIGSRIKLGVEEALYLLDVRNAICRQGAKEITFNSLAARSRSLKKFIARYFTYKDWRERGLVAISPKQKYTPPDHTPIKRYPASNLRLPRRKVHGVFFKPDLMTVVAEDEAGKRLYETLWFGQYGSYKAAERGRLNKLDVYETLFLVEKKLLKLDNITKAALVKHACGRRSDFLSLYGVYKDWREKGYIIKTGFKFGTHFRIYFPGARPMKKGDGSWTHSKHVIQVFPKSSKLLISEWARAIRVAHSVRKTFILAVPGKTARSGSAEIDFLLFHRHGGEADSPKEQPPKYAMLSLGEEEYLGGRELANAISEAKKRRMELLLAIADRETAVTYYKVVQITLPGSRHDYFEIDWFQP